MVKLCQYKKENMILYTGDFQRGPNDLSELLLNPQGAGDIQLGLGKSDTASSLNSYLEKSFLFSNNYLCSRKKKRIILTIQNTLWFQITHIIK